MPQLPNSVDTEKTLLGSIMVFSDTIYDAYENGVGEADFFLKRHQDIFRIIDELHNERTPIDPTSVVNRLADHDLLAKSGGAEYINELADLAFSEENVKYYARVVKEKAVLRQLIEVAGSISDDCNSNSFEFADVLSESEKKVLEITRNNTSVDFLNSNQAMDQVSEEIKRLQNQKGVTGVASGFSNLDNVTNGFRKGDLIILAARTSVGKTAFALNLAKNAALDGKAVAVFSLEMPTVQLTMRILSSLAKVDGMRINSGVGLTDNDYAKVTKAIKSLRNTRLFFDDSSTIRTNEIAAKCRKLKADGNLDLVIIDYLQLISPGTRSSDNRQQEVAEISRNLKGLARELEVPVIALAQVSRGVERQRASGEPMLSDLRESGAIEQDADVVIFLYRDQTQNNDDEEKTGPTEYGYDINVKIAKHRNGRLDTIRFRFEPNINSYSVLEKRYD